MPAKSHGLTNSRLYRVWKNIRTRCYNKKSNFYKYYGGKGIILCDEWKNDFKSFHDWAYANGYDENAEYMKCTIDRIDLNGYYEPSNCRWVTSKEQARNRTSNRLIEYNGEKLTLIEWAERLNMHYDKLRHRLDVGWNVKDAFEIINLEPRTITYNGEKHTIKEWAKILGINKNSLCTRLYNYHWSVEKAFTTPIRGK